MYCNASSSSFSRDRGKRVSVLYTTTNVVIIIIGKQLLISIYCSVTIESQVTKTEVMCACMFPQLIIPQAFWISNVLTLVAIKNETRYIFLLRDRNDQSRTWLHTILFKCSLTRFRLISTSRWSHKKSTLSHLTANSNKYNVHSPFGQLGFPYLCTYAAFIITIIESWENLRGQFTI